MEGKDAVAHSYRSYLKMFLLLNAAVTELTITTSACDVKAADVTVTNFTENTVPRSLKASQIFQQKHI